MCTLTLPLTPCRGFGTSAGSVFQPRSRLVLVLVRPAIRQRVRLVSLCGLGMYAAKRLMFAKRSISAKQQKQIGLLSYYSNVC